MIRRHDTVRAVVHHRTNHSDPSTSAHMGMGLKPAALESRDLSSRGRLETCAELTNCKHGVSIKVTQPWILEFVVGQFAAPL